MTKLSDRHKGKWYYIWRILIALIVWFFNTDWVVIPSLRDRALSIWGFNFYDLSWLIPQLTLIEIFFIVVIISTCELFYTYYFLVWGRSETLGVIKKKEPVREAVIIIGEAVNSSEDIKKEIKNLIEESKEEIQTIIKIQDRIKEFVAKWFYAMTSEELNPVIVRLKRLGYDGLFLFSAIPETGTRLLAILVCGLSGSFKGMLIVVCGNAVKNSLMVFAFWGPISRMNPHVQSVILTTIFLVIAIPPVVKILKSKKT